LGVIKAICIGRKKGQKKVEVEEAELVKDFGLKSDAHAGTGPRQVSLLAEESVSRFLLGREKIEINPGDFAENILTSELDLLSLKKGDRLKLGATALGEVTQIGKECVEPCSIFKMMGDCIMPREGVFIRILQGGYIKKGDKIEVIKS